MQGLQSKWFAVYTRPRMESVALENLERQGFHCFLPLANNPYQRLSNNNKLLIEALFSRYMFLRAVPEMQNLATVRSTRGVVGLVRSGFVLVRVPEAIIDGLRARLDPVTGLVNLDPVPLNPGDKVRLFDGPLAGVEGILEVTTGEQRALMLMEILGRPTTVAVDSLLLKRAS